jgi:hypothetical protein
MVNEKLRDEKEPVVALEAKTMQPDAEAATATTQHGRVPGLSMVDSDTRCP